MPAQEIAFLRQKALLWNAGAYDRYGQIVVDAIPTEINVRWDANQKRVIDSQGNLVSVDASAMVDRDIDIGSTMLLSSLEDWAGTGSNDEDNWVMEVITFSKVPDMKARYFTRTVGLNFYRTDVPVPE